MTKTFSGEKAARRPVFFLALSACLLFSLGPDLAGAGGSDSDLTLLQLEDLSKVDVVYAASKSDQKITEAPASISIITSKEIRAQGYRTLNDLLSSVRDFYITNDRQYSYIGMRGFGSLGGYNSRILMLVDGHRINDNIYDSFLTGQTDMVDIDMVDRVEIIRGPASSLYGSSAFLGIINVVTRQKKAEEGLILTSAGGSLQTVKEEIRYGGKSDSGFHWSLQGSLVDSGGNASLYYPEFNNPATNNGIAQNVDAEQSQHAYLSMGLGDWTIRGAYNNRKKIIPTGVYNTTFDDSGTYTSGQRGYAELVYLHQEGKDWELSGKASLDYANYMGNYVTGEGPSRLVNIDYSNGAWCGSEIQWTLKSLPQNKITLGAEFRDNFEETQGNYDIVTHLLDQRQSTLWALYAQDEIRLFPHVILNLGGRFDDYSTFGGQAVPRGALIWDPFENTTLKFMAGGAFRAPNNYELYYNDGEVYQEANPELKPETIQTYEVELDQILEKHHRFTCSLFHYSARNLINQVRDPSKGLLVFQNIGLASADGLDLEYQYQSPDGFQGRVSYTLQRAQDDVTGLWIPDSPQQLAKMSLQVPLFVENLSVAGECQYNGASLGDERELTHEFALFNLKLYSARLFADGLEANLAAYNLFDTRYKLPVANYLSQETLEQDGRTLWASLSCKM